MPSSIIKIISPIGGWNTTSAVVASISPVVGNTYNPYTSSNQGGQIQVNEAIVLDNLIPSVGSVTNRLGASSYATSVGTSNVDSLFELREKTVAKFIAAASNNLYDISTSGTATKIASGFTSNQWEGCVFNATLGIVNGSDAPQIYDGSTVSSMTISGPSDVTKLISIRSFKNRTYFVELNSQDFWYSALNVMGGTLTKFPLSRVGNFGGNLIGIETLTTDGGSGQQNLICFFMSTGEVIMYSGTDPGVDFSLIGVYKIGRPITQRAIIKYGPDIFVVTDQGYITLSSLLPLSYGKNNTEIGFKIKGAASTAVATYMSSFGWQCLLSTSNNLLVVNVPQSNNTFVQHVLNLNTNGWCRFTNLNARCWGVFGSTLYFGTTDGRVAEYGPNYTDFGSQYTAIYQSPYLELLPTKFQTTAFYPQCQYNAAATMTVQKSVDFKPLDTAYNVSYSTIGAQWGDAWGSAWNKANSIISYLNFNTIGYSVSAYLQFKTAAQMNFYKTDFMVKQTMRN